MDHYNGMDCIVIIIIELKHVLPLFWSERGAKPVLFVQTVARQMLRE